MKVDRDSLWSMSKTFRPWDVDQVWLFPPSVRDFVPAKHVAHFVRETVRGDLDLGAIFASYEEERGYPPYHPAMMVALLLYGYSRGVYSSRQLERACEERVDFMAVTGMNRPDFHTIAAFRRRHLAALGGLFVQVLKLCREAGLVKLGHVSLDGTKIKANASRHRAMSYGRMHEAEAKLQAEVAAWFARADAADVEEDGAHGSARGDELPDWVADKQQRLERLRAAKAALEAEAKAPPAPADDGPGPSTGMVDHGKPKRAPDGGPPDRAQRNFTDPDSRILKTADGIVQGYNAQIAVDGAHQIILAHRLQTNAADRGALAPLVKAIRRDLRARPQELSADAGYCDEANLAFLARRRIAAYLAPGRARHGTGDPAGKRRARTGSRVAAMATKLRRAGHRSRYRLRKQIVEPVFGQIKAARGFRQFFLRGLAKVRQEWAMICTAHNILKLAAAHR
jgi:transposase